MKNIFISLGGIILTILVVLISMFINFRFSYKYVNFQISIATKNKDIAACQYYDFEKIVKSNVNRQIKQNINLDNALNREHDHMNDIFLLQTFETMKDALVKQQKIMCENQFQNGNKNLDHKSTFKLFSYALNDKSIDPNKDLTVEKINKNKYEFTYYDKKKDEYTSKIFERINKKWIITEVY